MIVTVTRYVRGYKECVKTKTIHSHPSNHEELSVVHSPSVCYLAPVVQRADNAIHWINHYPVDSVLCFVIIYPLDNDLSGG